MTILLSPTKKQIIKNCNINMTNPIFLDKADKLMNILRSYNQEQLKDLLKISDKLTQENYLRFQVWRSNPNDNMGTPAIFSYTGEAFNFLNPNEFTDDDLYYANKTLRIFSGLYGILRPLDKIMPYRLDIKDSLKIENSKSLYSYWSSIVTGQINDDIKENKSDILLNLSSLEYSKTINFSDISTKIITPEFKQEINGKLKTVAIFSKRMRGLYASIVIKNRLKTEQDLQKIDLYDYKLEEVKDGHYLYVKRELLNENMEI